MTIGFGLYNGFLAVLKTETCVTSCPYPLMAGEDAEANPFGTYYLCFIWKEENNSFS